jgi:hypothetical protein
MILSMSVCFLLLISSKGENYGLWIIGFDPSIDPLPPETEAMSLSDPPVALLSFTKRQNSSTPLPLHSIVGWLTAYGFI